MDRETTPLPTPLPHSNKPNRRYIVAFMAVLIMTTSLTLLIKKLFWPPMPTFAVYYGETDQPDAFEPFDIIILSRFSKLPIAKWTKKKKLVAGYLSLGEAEGYETYYESIKSKPWVLANNPNWAGARYVDVRSPEWQSLILNQQIPLILEKGFNGLFLDTIDSSEFLQQKSPRLMGTVLAMIQLIKAIKKTYPHIKLISNNGFFLLPDVHQLLDYCLFESILSSFNFETKTYQLSTDPNRIKSVVGLMQQYPLKPLILDYAQSPTLKADLRQRATSRGWPLYLTTIDLRNLPDGE